MICSALWSSSWKRAVSIWDASRHLLKSAHSVFHISCASPQVFLTRPSGLNKADAVREGKPSCVQRIPTNADKPWETNPKTIHGGGIVSVGAGRRIPIHKGPAQGAFSCIHSSASCGDACACQRRSREGGAGRRCSRAVLVLMWNPSLRGMNILTRFVGRPVGEIYHIHATESLLFSSRSS